jgi:hypothetical protein
MIIYRATKRRDGKEHDGFVYSLSKRDANKIQEQSNEEFHCDDEVETLVMSMNKLDVIDFLNAHCAHPDNG